MTSKAAKTKRTISPRLPVARAKKQKTPKARAVKNLEPSLDPFFAEPVVSCGRSLAPLFGFGGVVVANHGHSCFIKQVREHFIVCAHMRKGGWQLVRDNLPSLATAWKHACEIATLPNVGPRPIVEDTEDEETETVPTDGEQFTLQPLPRVITTRRPNVIGVRKDL